MNVAAVIVAAGRSERMGGPDKLDIRYDGKTVLEHVLAIFAEHIEISEIILVVSSDRIATVDDQLNLNELRKLKPITVTEGGKTRHQSVKNGITRLSETVEYILIQDAARPFTTDNLISRTIQAAVQYRAAVGGVAVHDTIKIVDSEGFVTLTPDRAMLRAVGTPQVFEAKLLKTAIDAYKGTGAYDDCELIEALGHRVKIIEGEDDNIKITTKKDIHIYMNENLRVGHGYDAHRLVSGDSLILGGVEIPYEKTLLGHSDADVAVHAIIDSLLGAAALGDIGRRFPDSDMQYAGISSIYLLQQTVQLLTENGYLVKNIDCTIICEKPKLSKYIDMMRVNIADAVGIEVEQVSVKATTEEGMGYTGTSEGIASHAVAMVARLTKRR